jgi:hypothetical protein
MSNYFYKDISISTITNTTGSTTNAPDYNDFPVVPTTYTGLQPNDFRYYYISGGNILPVSQLCTANSILVTSTSNNGIAIPTGAKSFSFFGVSGGGGGGAQGGNANIKILKAPPESQNYSGGQGGNGGPGNYMFGYAINISGQTINQVVIGSGGNGGNGGGNAQETHLAGANGVTVTGQSASGGNAGTGTSFTIGSTKYSTGNTGGNGGGGGEGANVNYNTPSGFNGGDGTPGTPGTTPSNVNYPTPFPSGINFPNLGGYGAGGPAGIGNNPNQNAGQDGFSGNAGAIQFIWLYD